jgi:hypothetical protein
MPDEELNFTEKEASEWETAPRPRSRPRTLRPLTPQEDASITAAAIGIAIGFGILLLAGIVMYILSQYPEIRHKYPDIFETTVTYGAGVIRQPFIMYDQPNGKQIGVFRDINSQVRYEKIKGCWYKIMNVNEYPYGYTCADFNSHTGFFELRPESIPSSSSK